MRNATLTCNAYVMCISDLKNLKQKQPNYANQRSRLYFFVLAVLSALIDHLFWEFCKNQKTNL